MKRYYLAYGSNLNLNQMKDRCKHAVAIGTTVLENYRLVYRGGEDGAAYLTIEESEGDYVPMGIYEISISDEKSLNRYEGYPYLYHKKFFKLELDKKYRGEPKVVKALVYIMNDGNDYHIPSKEYVDQCVQGYQDFGFDKKLLNEALVFSKNNRPKSLKK